ncbi:DEAD/DEAH box helicase family protein, partial [Natronolimnohabitans sp. A-GB9]|uniref:DEAD/DEAH box helicase n=1 Tax=Natronolimnohabitans sp. A-GB9 TaxID=3069757 RepID=UPI0027AE0C0D
MKPVDKFGNRIHPSIFEELSDFGDTLRELGYSESRTKPNLFYYSPSGGIAFFMDMRGTSIVDIAEDTRPLFYWDIDVEMEDWAKRRLLKEERERLSEHGVPLRLSGARRFSAFGGSSPGDEDHLSNPFGPADGYCESCGRDFSDSGYYCSEECEREERPDRFCRACEDRVDPSEVVRHHVSYFPEEIVVVCQSCHNKIHFSDQYPELTPPEEEIRRFYDEEQEIDSDAGIAETSGSESATAAQEGSEESDRGWEDIFPFDPRPAQRDGIESALPVLDEDGYLILEGACGTGKTVMALTAAINQIVNGEKERLVVITPLKQQQQQFVEDLREINQNLLEYEQLNGLSLVGKKEVCPYSREGLVDFSPENVQGRCSDLRRETRETFTGGEPVAEQAREIVDGAYVGASSPEPDADYWPGVETAGSWSHFPQSELPTVEDSEVCPFYAQHYAYEKRPRFGFSDAPNHVFSGEDLVRTAVDENYCPHSAMYALIERVNVLIANYTHLFNDGVRALLDDFIDDKTLLIVDEAHNLEPRVRTGLDRTKAFSTIQAATDDLESFLNSGLIQPYSLDEEIAPELTKRHLQRAYDCLDTFIDSVHQEVSDHLDSEYTGWKREIDDTLRDSDERLDYIEEPDSLREECDLPQFEEMALQTLESNIE